MPPPSRPVPPSPGAAPGVAPGTGGEASRRRLRRVFLDAFVALDVAEPLCSFDCERPSAEVRDLMAARDFDRAGVRVDGLVRGWAERADLGRGSLRDHLRPFGPDDLVADSASLQEVIQSLAVNDRCFVTVLGEAAAIVTRQDLEKPAVRMFLFGMITLLEMQLTRAVERGLDEQALRAALSPGRLAKAEALRDERARRGHAVRLLDCLQFSDKGQLALKLPELQRRAEGVSRKETLRGLKELEELRNHLAHAQEIIPTGWARITVFTRRLDELLESA